jgi:hypothetical protein
MSAIMTNQRLLAALAGALILTACEKNAVQVLPDVAIPGASIKFFNFSPNAPQVNFYADETKMTAVLSATGSEANTGVAYGGAGNGGVYLAIQPGTHTLTGRIAAATDKDLIIATLPGSVEDGKFYSYYMTGFYNTTAKTSDAFLIEDPMNMRAIPTDFSVAYVRFVHAISNATGPLTLYARNTIAGDTTAIGAAVAYKGAGGFVALPTGIYDLFARYTDSTTNKVARTGVAFGGGRIYTIGARGDITITSTTATNRPFLDFTANR